MELVTKELEENMPRLYTTEDQRDPIVYLKLFCPWNQWTWFLTEYSPVAPDGSPKLGFGLVVGDEVELGYISLLELEAVRGPGGLRIERDLYFSPTPLSEIQRQYEVR